MLKVYPSCGSVLLLPLGLHSSSPVDWYDNPYGRVVLDNAVDNRPDRIVPPGTLLKNTGHASGL